MVIFANSFLYQWKVSWKPSREDGISRFTCMKEKTSMSLQKRKEWNGKIFGNMIGQLYFFSFERIRNRRRPLVIQVISVYLIFVIIMYFKHLSSTSTSINWWRKAEPVDRLSKSSQICVHLGPFLLVSVDLFYQYQENHFKL